MEAKKSKQEVEEASKAEAESVPTFTLRADKPRHIHALMAALHELPEEEKGEARRIVREFELYEETHRP